MLQTVYGQRKIKPEQYVANAQANYDAGNYELTLEELIKARDAMDTTNASIEYLTVKASHNLKRYSIAQEHLQDYFKHASDTTSAQFQEMRKLEKELNKSLGSNNPSSRDTSQLIGGGFSETETWEYATRTNNLNAYRNYLRFFPEGPHALEAKEKVDFEEKKANNPSKLIVSAVKKGDIALLKELLAKGADVNHKDIIKVTTKKSQGNVYEYYVETPLSIAFTKFDYALVKYLLEQGADPNILVYKKVYDYKYAYKPEEGRTRSLLENMIVATSRYGVYTGRDAELIDFIDLMLKYNLDINFYQGSPLATAVFYHNAKKYRRTLLIRYLLRKGADPRMKGKEMDSKSAIDVARERGDKKTLAILKDKKYKAARKEYQKKQEAFIRQQLNPENIQETK
ncbi:MAG: hypothetical protein SFW35_06175 [Chitinophagales bacterium]|nr:hypothetical protein [Chitinophagales bacterium]